MAMRYDDFTERGLLHNMAECRVPVHCWKALARYVRTGQPTGPFLTAVLSNDLRGAAIGADDTNKERLFDYMLFLYNCAPEHCWGSPENVAKWLEIGGQVGAEAAPRAKQEAEEAERGG